MHSKEKCRGEYCPFHNPSAHRMRDWPIVMRESGLVERVCKHGIGHPDPDSVAYFKRRGIKGMGIHGCDRCCQKGCINCDD